jgi:hypothetical protein
VLGVALGGWRQKSAIVAELRAKKGTNKRGTFYLFYRKVQVSQRTGANRNVQNRTVGAPPAGRYFLFVVAITVMILLFLFPKTQSRLGSSNARCEQNIC